MARQSLNIAVLGDLHGHLVLAYRVLKRWERESGTRIDLILQVGDLGAFPPPFRLDKATRRFAKKDPDELGFAPFYDGANEAAEIIGPNAPENTSISAPMYWIAGNHEDFDFLKDVSAGGSKPVAVDAFGKILYLPSGYRQLLNVGETCLRIGALGGIAAKDTARAAGHLGPAYYSNKEVESLAFTGDGIDILLTHETPYESLFPASGSHDVTDLIGLIEPDIHFFGHYHLPGTEVAIPGKTRSFHLNQVNFDRRTRQLTPGCIGLLYLSSQRNWIFAFLEDDWLREYTRDTYRHIST